LAVNVGGERGGNVTGMQRAKVRGQQSRVRRTCGASPLDTGVLTTHEPLFTGKQNKVRHIACSSGVCTRGELAGPCAPP
jgi:hypothetical protein